MTEERSAALERTLRKLESAGVRLGLESMRDLLGELGCPQERTAHVLVAGTNGKGSTAALLTSMLAAAGYRSGLYTSPHLEEARERIRIDGVAVSISRLERLLDRVLAAARDRRQPVPTYFEAMTSCAFLAFADEVDLAVLEVGMGGRLDATNVGSPRLSIVTEIGVDHEEFLGRGVESIAGEKAGVFRRGRPAVVGVHDNAAREVLRTRANDVGAIWVDVFEECAWRDGSLETGRQRYSLATRLAGEHQRSNLAIAVRAAECLADEGWRRLTPEAIELGSKRCRWPGRLEAVELPQGTEVILDAAHNPQSAAALAATLAATSPRCTLLFGVLGDKDVERILPPLAALASRVVLTTPPSPRAVDPDELVRWIPAGVTVEVERRPAEALDAALREPLPVVACGSIYLVGEVRRDLRRRFGVPPPAAEVDVTGRRSAADQSS